MEVISNLNGLVNEIVIDNFVIPKSMCNHLEVISFLIEKSDYVSITSPFIMQEFDDYFSSLSIENTKFELVTSCSPKGNEQLTKPFQIKNFANVIQEKTNKWPDIHLNQNLHSKIYLFYKNKKNICAIVTSANFTYSGLSKNHETGILTTNENIVKQLEEEKKRSLDFVSLRDNQIEMLCTTVKTIQNNKRHLEKQEDIDIGLNNIISKYCTPSAMNKDIKLRDGSKYFITVSGVSEKPILPEDKRKITEPQTTISFSKEPRGMRLGDCLLEVAVGGKCFLSYYAVASMVYERTEKEKQDNKDHARWPYYVYANNLSLNYGESWYENPYYYDEVIKDFKNNYPDLHVTPTGKDSISGAISFGSSYFKVTNEFGKYVKQILDNYDN